MSSCDHPRANWSREEKGKVKRKRLRIVGAGWDVSGLALQTSRKGHCVAKQIQIEG
jgi:hypothetical protein